MTRFSFSIYLLAVLTGCGGRGWVHRLEAERATRFVRTRTSTSTPNVSGRLEAPTVVELEPNRWQISTGLNVDYELLLDREGNLRWTIRNRTAGPLEVPFEEPYWPRVDLSPDPKGVIPDFTNLDPAEHRGRCAVRLGGGGEAPVSITVGQGHERTLALASPWRSTDGCGRIGRRGLLPVWVREFEEAVLLSGVGAQVRAWLPVRTSSAATLTRVDLRWVASRPSQAVAGELHPPYLARNPWSIAPSFGVGLLVDAPDDSAAVDFGVDLRLERYIRFADTWDLRWGAVFSAGAQPASADGGSVGLWPGASLELGIGELPLAGTRGGGPRGFARLEFQQGSLFAGGRCPNLRVPDCPEFSADNTRARVILGFKTFTLTREWSYDLRLTRYFGPAERVLGTYGVTAGGTYRFGL